ncbi:MAG TPA: Mov34/MPN/PAD-1 family protein [Planctomycetota bacterium]|nr:Mov34/MPN/PAD-1 family protein [Planctomycetota bacterium]
MSCHASRVTGHAVYILARVVKEVLAFCQRQAPNEALGVLVGRRCQHQGRRYVRVTDWATGSVDASPVHAEFTPQGVVECHVELDERYGPDRRPQIVGIFHSHPFGGEPSLSERDLATFGGFPYDAEGNVFVLVNPSTGHFLVFQRDGSGVLVEQEWVEYGPEAPEGGAGSER